MGSTLSKIKVAQKLKKAGPYRLPPELMYKIITHLEDTHAYSSLYVLQRTSKEMYMMVTPAMYREIGHNVYDISKRFRPMSEIKGKDFRGFEDQMPSRKHPVEWNRVDRVLWMFSHTLRIAYKPTSHEERQESEMLHLQWFTILLQRHTKDQQRLPMPNLEYFVVDLSGRPGPAPTQWAKPLQSLLHHLHPHIQSLPRCIHPAGQNVLPFLNQSKPHTGLTTIHGITRASVSSGLPCRYLRLDQNKYHHGVKNFTLPALFRKRCKATPIGPYVHHPEIFTSPSRMTRINSRG